jgi:N-acetyl-alpha-D-muramate 1-phosphate uridylyltransferase
MNAASQGRQVVILAGGLGTRMLPRTERIPKVLLDVAGRPFVAWLLERVRDAGYDEVVFCIGHLGEQVRAVVGDGAAFGVRAHFVDEGKELRGTGGAIVLAREAGLLHDEFLVTYGDSYLPFDYAAPLDSLRAHGEWDAVMAVYENDKRWDASNVELSADGSRVARYEKGADDAALRFIDYGATAIRSSALSAYPDGARFGLDGVQHTLAKEGRMGAYVAADRFYEIGSPQGHADLEAALRKAPS